MFDFYMERNALQFKLSTFRVSSRISALWKMSCDVSKTEFEQVWVDLFLVSMLARIAGQSPGYRCTAWGPEWLSFCLRPWKMCWGKEKEKKLTPLWKTWPGRSFLSACHKDFKHTAKLNQFHSEDSQFITDSIKSGKLTLLAGQHTCYLSLPLFIYQPILVFSALRVFFFKIL